MGTRPRLASAHRSGRDLSTGSCGLCIAVKSDPTSTFEDSQGFSHSSSRNSSDFVVAQNIDACPHNHTTNVGSSSGWCTEKQAQHIDLSCSGLGDISNLGTKVGQQEIGRAHV